MPNLRRVILPFMTLKPALSSLVALAICAPLGPLARAQAASPVDFVRIAAGVAQSVPSESHGTYIAIYVDDKSWHATTTDRDIGPLLAAQEEKPGRSAVCLLSMDKKNAVCVYFDNASPYGFVALQSEAGKGFQASDAAAAFKAITPDMLGHPGAFRINPLPVTSDNGAPMTAFLVSAAH